MTESGFNFGCPHCNSGCRWSREMKLWFCDSCRSAFPTEVFWGLKHEKFNREYHNVSDTICPGDSKMVKHIEETTCDSRISN